MAVSGWSPISETGPQGGKIKNRWPMMHHFQTEHAVPFPVELVFGFLTCPSNMPHLMPRWQQVRVESVHLVPPPPAPQPSDPELRFQTLSAGEGSEITISFRPFPLLPVRMIWDARIVEFFWNRHFTDELQRGPFSSWHHRHEIYEERRQGRTMTIVRDQVDYRLPLGKVGDLANSTFFSNQLEALFRYRQERLDAILPMMERQVQGASLSRNP